MKVTTKTICKLKGDRPIVALTAYDTITATLADRAGVDLILVGDSVGNTLLGFETTIPVTFDMIAHHTAAVARARLHALLVADLPFALAHCGMDQLFDAAVSLMQHAGAEAVKLEGGVQIAEKVAQLVAAGVPVMGHIGLLPQRYYVMGGYHTVGIDEAEKEKLLADAEALQRAGVFAIIGEKIDPKTTEVIASNLDVPLIGIGSGPHCDGQILVITDLLGLNLGKTPSFVKTYASLAESIENAISAFVAEVHEQKFPQ